LKKNGKTAKTAKSGIGYSFAAGSMEDGFSKPNSGVKEGETESMTRHNPGFHATASLLAAVFGQQIDFSASH